MKIVRAFFLIRLRGNPITVLSIYNDVIVYSQLAINFVWQSREMIEVD